MAHPKITQHAIVEIGKRFNVAVTRSQLQAAIGVTKPIFRMSGGEVIPFYVSPVKGWGYAVVNNGAVVTVLTQQQAFVDCPRAVFRFLIRVNRLVQAVNLRSYYKSLPLKPQDEPSVRYPRSCDTIWCAFKYLERA